MGFSIGKLLGGLAPIVGGLIGGPVGGLIGGVIGQVVSPTKTSRGPLIPQAGVPSGLTTFQQAQRIGGGASVVVAPAANGGMTVSSILALSRQHTGGAVSARKLRQSVQVCGIQITAQTLGLTVEQVCFVALSKPRRRGRGISAADMRRTRSTIRKVNTIRKSVKLLTSGRGF